MKPSKELGRLVEIMAALRDPATGCPWDVEQTPDTIVPFTIEETYEVVDAIERRDPVDLREELGDLLLQVVYHARFAEERGEFDLGDVIEGITRKMIRRHPHVFGERGRSDAEAAKATWNEIKAQEKEERAAARRAAGLSPQGSGSRLAAVSRSLPPLAEASAVQREMAKVGFDWPEPAPILDKVAEEADELRDAIRGQRRAEIEEEVGDLLFTVVNLARRLEVDPELSLRAANAKVRRRFGAVERDIENAGSSIEDATLAQMEAAWSRAKREPGKA